MKIYAKERLAAICEAFDVRLHTYKSGEQCSRACANHVTHRCEKCGRYQAMGESTIFIPNEDKK